MESSPFALDDLDTSNKLGIMMGEEDLIDLSNEHIDEPVEEESVDETNFREPPPRSFFYPMYVYAYL
jgi:hypothetical protein